jgi:hypothetical protein
MLAGMLARSEMLCGIVRYPIKTRSRGDLSPPVGSLFNLSLKFYSVALISGRWSGRRGPKPEKWQRLVMLACSTRDIRALPRPVAGCECWPMHLFGRVAVLQFSWRFGLLLCDSPC